VFRTSLGSPFLATAGTPYFPDDAGDSDHGKITVGMRNAWDKLLWLKLFSERILELEGSKERRRSPIS
jgi:hypothetical protein